MVLYVLSSLIDLSFYHAKKNVFNIAKYVDWKIVAVTMPWKDLDPAYR